MKRIFLSIFFIAGLICNLSCQEQKYKTVAYPDGYTIQIDVIYTRVNDWEGRMDHY